MMLETDTVERRRQTEGAPSRTDPGGWAARKVVKSCSRHSTVHFRTLIIIIMTNGMTNLPGEVCVTWMYARVYVCMHACQAIVTNK